MTWGYVSLEDVLSFGKLGFVETWPLLAENSDPGVSFSCRQCFILYFSIFLFKQMHFLIVRKMCPHPPLFSILLKRGRGKGMSDKWADPNNHEMVAEF